jgi:hypothetical protein
MESWEAGLERFFPWGVAAAVRLVLLVLVCGVGLVVVWFGVSGRGVFDTQVGWMTAGVVVLMVELYALASLVVRGRRAVGDRRSRLISDAVADVLPRLAVAGPTEVADGDVVVVAGLDLFHRAECPMVAERRVERVSESEAARRGLRCCGICAGGGADLQ